MGVQLKKQAIDLGIVTTRGEAMLGFYRDVLGLQYLREMPMPGGAGVMHQLMCGDSMVKVVVLDSTPEVAPKGGIPGATGYRYWTLTIDNLAEVIAKVEAAGHKVIVRERELRPGVTIGMVADPDGNWVEFLSVA